VSRDLADAGGARTAVVVVNYESGPVLASCVASLEAEAPAELVVVDNGSTDGSVGELKRRCPGIAVVDPGRNLGYGAAANRGVAATGSEFILVCNPDLSVAPGALTEMVAALVADPTVAVVGPLIRTPEGERYPSARQFPSMIDAAGHAMLGQFVPQNPFTRAYQQADLAREVDTVWPVDWVSGACFLVRRSGASTRKPALARASSWWRHEYQSSGKPWQRTTGGPEAGPLSATWSSIPLVGIWWWAISLMAQTFADLVSFSSECFWMADMMAAPASPMNDGRFSAAQSRLAVNELADPWN